MVIESLPSAPKAEKNILSCVFQFPETFISRARGEGLTPEMFHIHGRLFAEMLTYWDKHQTLDLSVFVQDKNMDGTLPSLGGPATMSEIWGYAPSTTVWEHAVRQLRETFARRIARNCARIIGDAPDAPSAIEETRKALDALTGAARGPKRSIGTKAAFSAFLDEYEADSKSDGPPGLTTGISIIDKKSGGMRKGEFWVTGGLESRGKSALMLQIAAHSLKNNVRVGVFSLEMTANVVVGRLLSTGYRIDYGKITQTEKPTEHDLDRIKGAISESIKWKLHIDDSSHQTIDSIRGESLRLRDEHGDLGLIVIDYLQLVQVERRKNESREQEIAHISRTLKQMAKELGCPVTSATQLNEDGKSRESRSIQQDADCCLYINSDSAGVVSYKMRNAQKGEVFNLALNGKYQTFEEGLRF